MPFSSSFAPASSFWALCQPGSFSQGPASPATPSSVPIMAVSVARELLEVVDHAVKPPLRADLLLALHRKSIQPFVVTQVGKHGLQGGDALALDAAAPGGVGRNSRTGCARRPDLLCSGSGLILWRAWSARRSAR